MGCKKYASTLFHAPARRKERQIEGDRGRAPPTTLISIPPKDTVAEVIGYLKGKRAIRMAEAFERKLRNFVAHKFWARR